MKTISIRVSVILCLVLQVACDRETETKNSEASQSSAANASPGTDGARPTVGSVPLLDKVPVSNDPNLESLDQQASYGIGYRIGTSILNDENIQVDKEAILAGLNDGLERRQRLTEDEMIHAAKGLEARATEKMAKINEARSDEAITFLKENALRNGVQMTPSGLQYEVLTEPADPEGPKPKITDFVTVDYQGTLLDGTIFDSSKDRDEPITFALRGVIPGWIEALQLMTVGEKRRLYLPPALGYGNKGAGSVPPYSVLIFDLELIGIKSTDASDDQDPGAIPVDSE